VSHNLRRRGYDPLTGLPDLLSITAGDLGVESRIPADVSAPGSSADQSPDRPPPPPNVKRAENIVEILGDEGGVSFLRSCPLIEVVWNTEHYSQPVFSHDDTLSHCDDLPLTADPAPVDPGAPVRRRLISHSFFPDGAIPRTEGTITSKDEIRLTNYLCDGTAQTFIDVANKVRLRTHSLPRCGLMVFTLALDLSPSINQTLDLPNLPPRLREECLSALRRACGHWVLLPRSLQIPICYDQSGVPHYGGGYADVWKGEYQGRPVAAKVLRVYSTSDLDKIRRVSRLVAQHFKHPQWRADRDSCRGSAKKW